MMMPYKSVSDVIKEVEYWLRLAIFLHGPLKEALLHVLHNKANDPSYIGLTDDPKELYKELSNKHQNKIKQLQKKKVLQQDQIDLILPSGGTSHQTFSKQFDVTLIVVLIRNCTTLKAPLNGWDDSNPSANDTSIAANTLRAREWRNLVHHTEPKDIDHAIFNQKWKEGEQILKELGCTNNNLSELKTTSIDPKHDAVLKSLFSFVAKEKNHNSLLADLQIDTATVKKNETLENLLIQLETIAKEVKYLKKTSLYQGNQDTCLDEVLNSISTQIGEQTEEFLRKLNIKNIEQLKDVPWTVLKTNLEVLGRYDIVNHVQQHTLITQGLQNASTKLRQHYITNLVDCLVEQPLATVTNDNQYISREQHYIDLAVLEAKSVDNEMNNSDRQSMIKQKYLRMSCIDIIDIFQPDDELVFIRGVAGIGKSTMIDLYTLKWAKNQLHDKADFDYFAK